MICIIKPKYTNENERYFEVAVAMSFEFEHQEFVSMKFEDLIHKDEIRFTKISKFKKRNLFYISSCLPSLFSLCILVPNYHSTILLLQQHASVFLIGPSSFHINLTLVKLITS